MMPDRTIPHGPSTTTVHPKGQPEVGQPEEGTARSAERSINRNGPSTTTVHPEGQPEARQPEEVTAQTAPNHRTAQSKPDEVDRGATD